MLEFPHPSLAQEDGLLAVGGNFDCATLLSAYRQGIFPWSEDPITWWSPDPRGIMELESFVCSRRTQRKMRQAQFSFTRDQAFVAVITACAQPRTSGEDSWIGPAMIEAYTELHRLGHAHSVECWCDGELIGGIYGLAIGGFFAGESMFSAQSDGSKMALVHLIEHLRARHFSLFDLQMLNAHTESLGATEIPRDEYLQRLRSALAQPCRF